VLEGRLAQLFKPDLPPWDKQKPMLFMQSCTRLVFLLSAVLFGPAWLSACSGSPSPQTPSSQDAKMTAPGRILFVLSSASEQRLRNGKTRDTGYFLGEFYEPYRALRAQGYEVDIATPDGKKPALDPESTKDKYWDSQAVKKKAVRFIQKSKKMKSPLSLADALSKESEYQGLIVPGGQGVMVDLLDDRNLHDLISTVAKRGGAIGLICHAPAILTRLPNGGDSLAGRNVTSVSGFEEFYIETFVMGGDAKVRNIGKQLNYTGFDYESALPKSDFAVRDCNLVTSQNPFSGSAFNEEYLLALKGTRRGVICK